MEPNQLESSLCQQRVSCVKPLYFVLLQVIERGLNLLVYQITGNYLDSLLDCGSLKRSESSF